MTIIIQAPPDVEATLRRAASQEGVSVEEYALQAILHKAEVQVQRNPEHDESMPQDTLGATRALFAQWAENPTNDPEEITRRRHQASEIFERLTRGTSRDERPFHQRATPEEWKAALHAYVFTHDPNLPVLTDKQMRREHLYEDRL